MNTNAKKILLTGTAFLAVSLAGVGVAQAQQTISVPVAITTPSTGIVNYTADVVGTLANGGSISHNITTSAANQGTLALSGNASISGTVGSGNALKIISVNGANGTTAAFGIGAVNAQQLIFTGAGAASFGGTTGISGVTALGNGSLFISSTNTFTATGGITGTGTITFESGGTLAGGAVAATTVINTAGTSTLSASSTLSTLSVNAGSLNVSSATSSVSGATAIGANILTFGGSSLATVTGNGGTLNLNSASAQAVSGNIGVATTGLLNTVALSGAGAKTLNGAVHATNVTTNASTVNGTGAITATNLTNTAGTSSISNAVTANTLTNTAGALTLSGATTVANGVTVTAGSLTISNAASTIAGTSAIGANTLNFGGSSIGTVNGGIGTGTLNLTSGTTTVGTVGSAGNKLATVSIGTGTKTFGANLHANELVFTGAGTANLTNTTTAGAQTIKFAGQNGTVTYGASTSYTGSATTTTNNTGHLAFGDNASILGAIGSAGNALNTVTFAGGVGNAIAAAVHANTVNTGTGTLNANSTITGGVNVGTGTVNANSIITGTVNYAGNGIVNLLSYVNTISGAITTDTNNTGTLNLNGTTNGHTLAGAVGTSANRLATVTTANTSNTTTFTGGVNATTLIVAAGGSVAVNGSSAITNALSMTGGTLTIGNAATLIADAGVTAATTGVALNGASASLITNAAAASTLQSVTKMGSGASTVGGTGAVTIGSVSINSGAGSLDITNAGSTITGTSFIGTGNVLNFAGSSMGATNGAGTLTLTSGATTVGAIGSSGNNLASVNVGTGTKTFGTDLYTNVLSFTNTGTADLRLTTTAGGQNINFSALNGTVLFGNGMAYSGNVLSSGGNGNVTFGDNATVTGTIGSGGKINALTFAGGTNSISTAVNATTMNIGAGGLTASNTALGTSVNFTADSTLAVANGTNITGNVGASTAGQGTLAYAGGGLTIGGNLGQLKALSLTSSATVGGTAFAANTTDIGTHKLTVNGTSFTTAGAATQLNFSVYNNTGGSGQILANGAGTVLTIDNLTKVNVSVDTADVIVQGQEYVLIDGNEASASTIGTTFLTTTNTALLRFKQKLVADGVSDGTRNLIVYADRTQMSTVTVDPNNGAVGQMLDALGADGDADIDALQVRLANFGVGQGAAVEQMLSTLLPNVSGATVATTANLGSTTSTIVNNRVGSVRTGGLYGSGESSGNQLDGKNFWGQVFGASADQGKRGMVAGYDAESYGAVFGVDADVMDNLRAGIAFAYADTDVSGEDSNRTSTEIDSYQVSLYADMNLPDDYFLSGQLAYMYSDIDTARHNVGGLAGNTARANFHSNQYTARGEVGRSFAVERGLSLTPSALVNYNYIDVADYSEKGVGGLGLRNVKTDEMQILEFGVNLIAEMNLDDGHGGIVTPNLHGGYRYDVIGDDVATSARLAGGGTAFKTQGADAAKGTGNIGTGIKWSTASNLDLSVNYDFEGKSDYKAHSGYVRAGYKF